MTWGRRSPLRVVPRRTPTESTSHPRRNVDDPSGSTFGLPSCCETRGTVEGGRRSRLLRSSLSFADEIGLVFWDRDFTESRRRRPRGPGSTLCRSRDGPRGGEWRRGGVDDDDEPSERWKGRGPGVGRDTRGDSRNWERRIWRSYPQRYSKIIWRENTDSIVLNFPVNMWFLVFIICTPHSSSRVHFSLSETKRGGLDEWESNKLPGRWVKRLSLLSFWKSIKVEEV